MMTLSLNRRDVLKLATGFLSAGVINMQANAAKEFNIKKDIAEKLDLGYRSGLLEGIHAVLAIHKSKTVLEKYYSGEDQNWGQPLGHIDFNATTLHDLRSVTKSITSLLYGIALERGKVPAPAARLLDSFPQYVDLASDPQRSSWIVENVLNMTLGTEWNEDLPYSNPANSEIMMENAADRYRFILDRPIVQKPGTSWIYNGGCSAILGYLIAKNTGQTLEEFARQALFESLDITSFEWNKGGDGIPSAASGLRLTAPNLARIGQMILAQGMWNGQQIVPATWLQDCMTPKVQANFFQYSNQWYLSEQPVPATNSMHAMISAMGNGGQRLFVIPSLDLVIVVFAGHYNRPDQWLNPTLILRRIVLANFHHQ